MLISPCGERMNISAWPPHLMKCARCLGWYQQRIKEQKEGKDA